MDQDQDCLQEESCVNLLTLASYRVVGLYHLTFIFNMWQGNTEMCFKFVIKETPSRRLCGLIKFFNDY